MSTHRTLGKGRVLGSGKPSAPTPSSPSPIPEHLRNTGLLSPSGSSASLISHDSTSKSSIEEHNDISSAVASSAILAQERRDALAATTRMICPICSEEMVTLLQLNRHIDDTHQHLQDTEQDEVKTWFKTQMVKAKRFQPLAVLNQKLKGLDVFEPNGETVRTRSASPASQAPISSTAAARSTSQARATPVPPPESSTIVDHDELITRDHWQRHTRDNTCSDPLCGNRLGTSNGHVNCRHCGKLFCEEHTMYQMKLSSTAVWEPVRGYWARVCETCYKSRKGYNDNTGMERNHMTEFAAIRRKAVDKNYLEVSRLEKRLTKLTRLLADPAVRQDQGVVSYLWSFSGQSTQQRLVEQSVVDWEDDTKVANCPFCKQEFSQYSFRRHHCRLCGRVVCADPNTMCSSEVGLNVAAESKEQIRKDATTPLAVDIRMCQDCKRTVFSKSDFDAQLAVVPPDQRAFDNLKQFERGIRAMQPRFHKLLTVLQDPNCPPTPQQLSDATRSRKRLTDAFTQYNIASRRIKDLPTTSVTQKRLQETIFAQATTFLHIHMLPLKALPKVLKHASPNGMHGSSAKRNGHLAPALRRPNAHSPSASFDSTTVPGSETPSASSRLSELETEERELRERLVVLEEQKFMVEEMVRDAQRRRKFEEVEALGRNLEEVGREVDSVSGMLANLDLEVRGVFVNGEGSGTANGNGKTREGKG